MMCSMVLLQLVIKLTWRQLVGAEHQALLPEQSGEHDSVHRWEYEDSAIGLQPRSGWLSKAKKFFHRIFEDVITADCTLKPHLPLEYLSEVVDFSAIGKGNVSYYPKMYLPNIKKALVGNAGLLVYNCTEFADFFRKWNGPMDARAAVFEGVVTLAPSMTPASTFFKVVERAAQETTEGSGDIHEGHHGFAKQRWSGNGTMPFLQGANEAWDTDTFTAEFIGHTLLAIFLEKGKAVSTSAFMERGDADRTFVLDLSGDKPANDAPEMQKLKARATALAPKDLLRSRGYLNIKNGKLRIHRVEVQDSEDGSWKSFTPGTSSKAQWSLAKSVLMSIGLYVVEVFHTGIHLFSGTVIEAASEALPEQSDVRGMVSPQATFVVLALLEQASLLHADHDAAFTGGAWRRTDTTALRNLTQDVANFFFRADPRDILGPGAEENKWWAGGAQAFVEPIADFAASMAAAVTVEIHSRSTFADTLNLIGGYESAFTDMRTEFARLYRNMLFVQGICHTHMFATREALTPLMGWTGTEDMLPALRGSPVQYDPPVTQQQKSLIGLIFATAAGFNSGFPQMGDGPWPYTKPNGALALAIAKFQGALAVARQSVEKYFANRQGGFVPSYFFTVEAKKPFGYGITQTSYI